MALKIIGAGFGRTGTLSVYTALRQLGFPCYHMFEVLENKDNKSHLDFWRKVANSEPGAQHDWEQVFAKYTATVDNPACCVWRELMAAYPDAKVLLTVHPRGAEAWYESTMDTIYFTETMWQFKVLELTTPFGRKFGDMSRKLIWQRSHQGTMEDRDRAIAHYHRHIEDVKAAVPADRLLVFSVDQGWEPLCRFLDVPVPQEPFPNLNDRPAIKKTLRAMTRGAYVILGLGAAALAAVAWGALALLHPL
ncbi:MAG: sulfotransferase family protein [Arenicellales bacterium]